MKYTTSSSFIVVFQAIWIGHFPYWLSSFTCFARKPLSTGTGIVTIYNTHWEMQKTIKLVSMIALAMQHTAPASVDHWQLFCLYEYRHERVLCTTVVHKPYPLTHEQFLQMTVGLGYVRYFGLFRLHCNPQILILNQFVWENLWYHYCSFRQLWQDKGILPWLSNIS